MRQDMELRASAIGWQAAGWGIHIGCRRPGGVEARVTGWERGGGPGKRVPKASSRNGTTRTQGGGIGATRARRTKQSPDR